MIKADIEIVNKGGADNIIIKAVTKTEAEEANKIIENMMKSSVNASHISPMSIADELRKLADLKEQGLLTADEFQTQKQKLMG